VVRGLKIDRIAIFRNSEMPTTRSGLIDACRNSESEERELEMIH
jgi:hypothetical protein